MKIAIFFGFMVIVLSSKAQHHHGLMRAKHTEEYNWNESKNEWEIFRIQNNTYHTNGVNKVVTAHQVEGTRQLSDSIVYDSIGRLEFRSIKVKEGKGNRDSILVTNCYTNNFEQCGHSFSQWSTELKLLELKDGFFWENVVNNGIVTERIAKRWHIASKQWLAETKEVLVYHDDVITEIVQYNWNSKSSDWDLTKRTKGIIWLDYYAKVMSECTIQHWDGNAWKDVLRSRNFKDGANIFTFEEDILKDGHWVPLSRKIYEPNEEFNFERFINGKWFTTESLVKYPYWNYHKRLTFSDFGDTLEHHHHEYEYDTERNAIHYWEYNKINNIEARIENIYVNTYDEDNHLVEVIQKNKTTDGDFRDFKRWKYSNFIDVHIPNGVSDENPEERAECFSPNPSKNGLFYFAGKTPPLLIKIVNNQGQVVGEQPLQNGVLNLQNLPMGMYTCMIYMDGNFVITKLVYNE